jgi:hypothetical protein
MSGGKRTDRISQRDLEVLEFVARYGVVPRSAMARWADTAKTATFGREKRLQDAGLIEVERLWLSTEPVLLATKAGLAACRRRELWPARVSAETLRHFSVAAQLAAELERIGHRLLSERELRTKERAIGGREFSIRLPAGRYHRPDLILLGERPCPIEVELSAKGNVRLDRILAGWAAAVDQGRFAKVIYHCSPQASRYVERSVERVGGAGQVEIKLLPDAYLRATSLLR